MFACVKHYLDGPGTDETPKEEAPGPPIWVYVLISVVGFILLFSVIMALRKNQARAGEQKHITVSPGVV